MPSPALLHHSLTLSPLLITTLIVLGAIPIHALTLPRVGLYDARVSPEGLSCAFDLAGFSFDLCSLVEMSIPVVEVSPEASPSSSSLSFCANPMRIYNKWKNGRRKLKLSFPPRPRVYKDVASTFGGSLEGLDRVRCRKYDNDETTCTKDSQKDETLSSPPVKSIELGTGMLKPCKARSEWRGRHTLTMTLSPTSQGVITEIILICDSSRVLERLKGTVTSERDILSWRAPEACPTLFKSLDEGDDFRISEEATTGDQQPPPKSDGSGEENPNGEGEGEGDLLPPKPKWRSRRWIAAFIFIFGIIAIGARIIVSSRRARRVVLEKMYELSLTLGPITSQVTRKIRRATELLVPTAGSSTFRQGDSRLVQWAEEDMSLQEDFMVNGNGAYELDGEDWNGANLDEYIPLTISPKWGRKMKMKSYGSAGGSLGEIAFPKDSNGNEVYPRY